MCLFSCHTVLPRGGRKALKNVNESVVILGIGSQALRLHYAREDVPLFMPHCLAERRKEGTEEREREFFLPDKYECTEDGSRAMDKRLREVMELRREVLVRRGVLPFKMSRRTVKRGAAPFEDACYMHVAGWEVDDVMEEEAPSIQVSGGSSLQEETEREGAVFHRRVFGEDVFELPNLDEWEVRYPIQRGHFHIPSSLYGNQTLQHVIDDLVEIWDHAFNKVLGIPKKRYNEISVVAMVPDSFFFHEISAVAEILLGKLGFRRLFLHQESVCTTFAYALTSGIVVDIGSHKTVVSCVQDGYLIPKSRVFLPYGLVDVAETLHFILVQLECPYVEGDVYGNVHDQVIFVDVAESDCRVQEDAEELVSLQIRAQKRWYRADVGDPVLLAGIGLFNPSIFHPLIPDVLETWNRFEELTSIPREDPSDYLSLSYLLAMQDTVKRARQMKFEEKPDPMDEVEIGRSKKGLLGLDDAIVESITRAVASPVAFRLDEFPILLAGCGARVKGLNDELQKRVNAKLVEQIEGFHGIGVLQPIDGRTTSWFGAKGMAARVNFQDAWITRNDWSREGIMAIRMRAPFSI
eukprot:TRINITY_DN49907_c0_g1_i1.p1 TRINITY_DN49907_c0_g1~~TRINITY_DN49907_c0_g1_i1.p1  ORF type:complete len:579 (-),score=180.93 TRINITY_DN49907_c0_g1_i1:64-1800(-)